MKSPSLLAVPALVSLAAATASTASIEIDAAAAYAPRSHDDFRGPHSSYGFQLEVQPSEEACGYAHVTLDGQELPQSLSDDVYTGQGSIALGDDDVLASWTFHCVKVNGIPDSQLLKFIVEAVNGKPIRDAGFMASFRQVEPVEILKIETDLSIPEEVVANPNHEKLEFADGDMDHSIHEELDELEYLWSQLREIKYLIAEKERSLHQHADKHHKEDVTDCDSLKCVVRAVAESVKHAVEEIYGNIRGEDDFERESEHRKHKKPHFPKFGKGHGKNDTGGHGNHTHPPPHGKKPHHPPPICRYPPPGRHGQHGPPPPPPPPPPHHKNEGPPDFDGPPPDHGEHKHSRPSPDFDGPEDRPYRGGPPDFDGPDDRPHQGGPPFDYPPPGPPPPHAQDRLEDAPSNDHSPPGPQDGPPPFPHDGVSRTMQIIKFSSIGFLFAFLLLALHRRACTTERHANRRSRREERSRRRAYRRAAHKHVITRILARISGRDDEDTDMDYEEKREELLARAEDGMSTTISEEITQLRNGVEAFGQTAELDAEESTSATPLLASGTAHLTPSTCPTSSQVGEQTPLMSSFENMSQIGYEDLPAYEDNDGSEMAGSSMIADGFMGAHYTPSVSDSGSVSDILGPDVKN